MKDVDTTATPSWVEFMKVFSEYIGGECYGHISMYDVFNRPPRSRTGLPKVIDNKFAKQYGKYNYLTFKDFVGKNIKSICAYKNSNWFQVQMCTPLKDGIIGFPIDNMDMFTSTFGKENVIKIYNFIKTNI